MIYDEVLIYSKQLFKNGKYINKAALLYIDDPMECDCCDEIKPLAKINTLGSDVMGICENCLNLVMNEFKYSREYKKRERLKKLKRINEGKLC